MAEMILEILTQIIKIVFVSIYLSKRSERRKVTWHSILIYFLCIILCLGNYENNFKDYLLINFAIYILFFLLAKKKNDSEKLAAPLIAFLLLCYEGIIFFSSFCSVIIISIFSHVLQNKTEAYPVMIAVLTVFRSLLSFIVMKKIIKEKMYVEKFIRPKYDIVLFYFVILTVKVPFIYTDIVEHKAMKGIVIAILSCCLLFCMIYFVNRRKITAEMEEVEEENKRLSGRLHKSQELYPVLFGILTEITSQNFSDVNHEDIVDLLAEVQNFYGQEINENERTDLYLKNFCSTGLKLFDRQLMIYQTEAINKKINLDILVQGNIKEIIQRSQIDQYRLQRTLGDLVRNSFHAIVKREDLRVTDRRMLIIIGCRNHRDLEIMVADNGVAFPQKIIANFGERGMTTDGTGNGLADLVDFVKDIKASVYLEEMMEEGTFTKKIVLVFDQKEEHIFNSDRDFKEKGTFWN